MGFYTQLSQVAYINSPFMPTIQSLVSAQQKNRSVSAFADLDREQLVTRLESLYRQLTLFDATERVAGIGHYEWSRINDRLESCSEQFASLFEMSIEEALASHSSFTAALQLVHPEDRDLYVSANQKMIETGELEVDFRIELADGSIRHVRETAVAVFDDDGVETGSFGLLQDITRQVHYEQDLEHRDALAQQTEEITDIGHYIYDEEEGRYLYLSGGYARIHGFSVEACLDRWQNVDDDLNDIYEEDRARVAEEYRRCIESGDNCAIEYRMVRADGAIRWVRELAQSIAMKNGRVQRTLGVVQDITDQITREQDLSFKEALASQAEAITDIGYFLFDIAEDRHVFVSQGLARILGFGIEEFRQRIQSSDDYLERVAERDRERIRELYRDIHLDNAVWEVEYRIRRGDGEERWVREAVRIFRRTESEVEEIIGVIQDITETKKIEEELLYKDALANQAETITEIGHFIYDEIRSQYLFVSPGLARILDTTVEDMLSWEVGAWGELFNVHPDDKEHLQKVYDGFLRDGDQWQVDYRIMRNDGEVRWIREMGKTHVLSHGIPEQTVGVLQDVTVQKQAEQEIIQARDTLEQQVVERTVELANTVKQLKIEIEEREKITAELHFLANHDALTGLPSLRLCKDRLDQSLAEARRKRQASAVMFLDLDGFKEINDRYGHEFGDRVLRAIAERITSEIRETDTVARIGGDEFVIILSSLPQDGIADRIAGSLIGAISRPLEIDSTEVAVSASIGISLYPDNGVTSEELIRSADKAMYCVKRQGKNNFGFLDSTTH